MSALTYRRVGHKGADHIAPGNTLASFNAALAAGVDMVEFDVLSENPDGSGRLLLAHDYRVLERREALTLEQGLAHFATQAFAGIELDVDLKLAGYEQRVVDALREHGLAQRALISTMETGSLPIIRAAAPDIKLGWSVPKARRNYLGHPLTRHGAQALVLVGRRVLPRRVARELRAGHIDAVMAHQALVTRRLVQAVTDAGGELYVWTVDDAPTIARLEQLGVSGIISNDPRLFLAVPEAATWPRCRPARPLSR